MSLKSELIKYSDNDIYPMHMPGHKRNVNFFPSCNPVSIDITEIDGFDNLHNPNAILKWEADRISKLYGCDKSIISVNGSTGAIISSIYASTVEGDTVLMARNCHMSVYNATMLRKLNVVFINPSINQQTGICNAITADSIEKLINNNPKIKLVIITSPTYEGIASDIKAISKIAHNNKIPLMVDEAHGSHFAFSDYFPESAIKCGADIVINSFHKTLPCFTSCAAVHVKSEFVDALQIQKAMDIFETSSPSYILLAGISHCMDMLENRKTELFSDYILRLKSFNERCKDLKKLSVMFYGNDQYSEYSKCFDLSKIVVLTNNCNINAKTLYNILLNKYKIQCEMHSAEYLICMTSVADTDKGFQRLAKALVEIDSALEISKKEPLLSDFPYCEKVYSPWQVSIMKKDYKYIQEGLVSADYIYAYPPGVPVIIPGEKFNFDIINLINYYKDKKVKLFDSEGLISDKVAVVDIDI